MTLPTIRHGLAHNGRYYAEFTPDGMVFPVRVYGETQQEAETTAFDFLADHDKAVRDSQRVQPGFVTVPPVEEYADDIRALNAQYAVEATADPVDRPEHYTRYPVEPIELTQHLNFCRGNAVKYLIRAGHKDAAREVEDLRKALWYVEREIERLRGAHGAPRPTGD
jgi:hypothetical protein